MDAPLEKAIVELEGLEEADRVAEERVEIYFSVPRRIADQMRQESVWLDVFGNVRWSHNDLLVTNVDGWTTRPVAP